MRKGVVSALLLILVAGFFFYYGCSSSGSSTDTTTTPTSTTTTTTTTTTSSTTGTVKGRVMNDMNKGPIRWATVYLKTNPDISTMSDEQGYYTLNGVPPGSQRIWAKKGGFDELDRTSPPTSYADVTVTAGQSVTASDIWLIKAYGSITLEAGRS